MRFVSTICVLAVSGAAAYAQPKAKTLVDLEMMTWPELKQAIEAGKTTALVYNGGTETRGPQNVNGGHTLMAHATVVAIAEKLGNAIAAPVLPFSPNNANANLPGTIGLTAPLFASINERVAEQLIVDGFKNVVLMGDHGGGQKELGEVAKKLDEAYAPKGIRVVYCDEVYEKANADFDKYLTSNGMPLSSHAGIPDTSEMLYLGGDLGWVRKELVATAVGDPVRKPGEARGAQRQADQQRHYGRCAAIHGSSRQASVRYEGGVRGESDPSAAGRGQVTSGWPRVRLTIAP